MGHNLTSSLCYENTVLAPISRCSLASENPAAATNPEAKVADLGLAPEFGAHVRAGEQARLAL